MNENYWKKAFEKLAEQIRLEKSWAEDSEDYPMRTYKDGMNFTY